MSLRTISKKDPEFDSYLRGTFSKTERALPLRSLNVNTEQEEVTFQIVPLKDLRVPSFLILWADVFKIRHFLFLGFPILLLLLKNSFFDELEMDPLIVTTATLGSFFLLLGGNLLNDYFDHMRGLDRTHPDLQSRPLQKGWVTAEASRRWAFFHLGLGVLLGLPSLFVSPELLAFALLPAGVAAWAIFSSTRGMKYRWGSELLVFLMAGPLFALGFQLAVIDEWDWEAAWIGVVNGLLVVFLMHLQNFRFLVFHGIGRFQNTISRRGFEGGKKFLVGWWLATTLTFCAYHLVYWGAAWGWVLMSALVPLFLFVPFYLVLRRLKSPAGSEIKLVLEMGRRMCLLTMTWWLLEFLWLALLWT